VDHERKSHDRIDNQIMTLSRGTGWKALYAKLGTGMREEPDLRNVPDNVGTGMTERTTTVKVQEVFAGRSHGVFADEGIYNFLSSF
jgi:hypothetical protein